ncbi:MAG: hypothetical protein ACTSRZ_04895 [Promethearchaeota archaeon]
MQLEILLGLNICVASIKFILFLILLKELIQIKNKKERPGYNILMGFTILIFSLFLSRIFYMIFDFVFTKLDIKLYHLTPNIWFWKLGVAISALGTTYLLYHLDKKIYNYKFKGIFALLPIIGTAFILPFPINSTEDFQLLSGISIFFTIGAILILIIFADITRKTTGSIRKMAFYILIGLILWAIGGTLLNLNIVNFFIQISSESIQIPIYFISAAIKISGLILFANGALKFSI